MTRLDAAHLAVIEGGRIREPRPQAVVPAPIPNQLIFLPQTLNIAAYCGDDLSITLPPILNANNTPADLTGATVAAQIRTTQGAIVGAFTCSFIGNVITMTLPHATTATLVGAFVYDCQITYSSGIVSTVFAGVLSMTEDVTRP